MRDDGIYRCTVETIDNKKGVADRLVYIHGKLLFIDPVNIESGPPSARH